MRRFPTVNVNGKESSLWELEGQPDVPMSPVYEDGRWRTALLGCYAFLTLLALGAVGSASNDLAADDQSVSTVGFLAGTIVVLHGVLISLPVFRGYPLLGDDGALLDSSRMASPATIAALVSHVLMMAGVVLWIMYVAQVGGPGIALGLALVLLAAMGLMVFVHWRSRRLAPPAGVSGRSVGLGIATLLLFPLVYLVGLVGLYATGVKQPRNEQERKTKEPAQPDATAAAEAAEKERLRLEEEARLAEGAAPARGGGPAGGGGGRTQAARGGGPARRRDRREGAAPARGGASSGSRKRSGWRRIEAEKAQVRLAAEEAERKRLAAEEAERKRLAQRRPSASGSQRRPSASGSQRRPRPPPPRPRPPPPRIETCSWRGQINLTQAPAWR